MFGHVEKKPCRENTGICTATQVLATEVATIATMRVSVQFDSRPCACSSARSTIAQPTMAESLSILSNV